MSAADRSPRGWIDADSHRRGLGAALETAGSRCRPAGVACLTCLAAACKVGMRHRSNTDTASLCRPGRPSTGGRRP